MAIFPWLRVIPGRALFRERERVYFVVEMDNTPILCRVCKKKLGVVRRFEGKIFSLCVKCEEIRKKAKRRRQV